VTVIFTAGARADLDDILAYTKDNFPGQLQKLEDRIKQVIARIERYPKSAPALTQHRTVRVVPLIRYPFRIFYREISDGIEILHIHHAARQLW
jgi:plasmid stabilization system protein ParE